jgi:carbamoyl-phosphate synthase large subunit
MKNILVLGASGNVSIGIIRVIKKNFPEFKIFGACVKESFSEIYCDEFVISPYASSPFFLSWLIDFIKKNKIDLIFSGVEEIIEVCVENKQLISNNTNCFLTFSNVECINIGNSKFKTVEWLKDNNFHYPKYFMPRSIDELSFIYKKFNNPIILKPIRGKGSQGIIKIYDDFNFNSCSIDFNNYIAQELIGSDSTEYTVGCYQNAQGDVMKPIVMRRTLDNGNTTFCEIIDNESISDYCYDITSKFNPMGPLNIQLRLNNNNIPICFELNVRFSGTSLIRDYFGFRDIVSMVEEKLFNKFEISNFNNLKNGTCIRMVDELFFESTLNHNYSKRYE